MKCTTCGKDVADDAKFCPFCGEHFSKNVSDVLSDNSCPVCGASLKLGASFCGSCGSICSPVNKCEKCGAPLKEGSAFCGVCGNKANSSYTPAQPDYGKTAKHSTGFIITVIILTVLLVALSAAIIIFLLSSNYTNHTKQEAALIPSPEAINQEYADRSSADKDDDSAADDDEDDNNSDEYNAKSVSAPYFSHISASSVREAVSGNYYNPQNVLDGRSNTAWTEGVDGYGIGQSISFYADSSQGVCGIKILNGYCKSEELYYKNSRVKKLKLSFSNGHTYAYELPDVFDKYTVINLNTPEYCTSVTLTILDIYAGTAYDDTCISEILFF